MGRRRYEPVHALQKHLIDARRAGAIGDVVLLVEHEPVITLGRAANPRNVLSSEQALALRGIDRVETGRGGDVTYHGPGQLVAYPIVDLKPDRCDVRAYVRGLAEAMILILREHHIEAGIVEGLVGVWVDRATPTQWATAAWARDLAKIGAIGVRISRWITMHGFALNLAVDLDAFQLIVPCGITAHGVTSVHALGAQRPDVREVAFQSRHLLERALDFRIDEVEDLSQCADIEASVTSSGRAPRGGHRSELRSETA
jgi:lipoyl(octanoyl) transferase